MTLPVSLTLQAWVEGELYRHYRYTRSTGGNTAGYGAMEPEFASRYLHEEAERMEELRLEAQLDADAWESER